MKYEQKNLLKEISSVNILNYIYEIKLSKKFKFNYII